MIGFFAFVGKVGVSYSVVTGSEISFSRLGLLGALCDDMTYFPLKIGSSGELASVEVPVAI